MARDDIDLDRLGTVSAVVAIVAVGISTLAQQLVLGVELFIVPPWLWWVGYAVFFAVMLAEHWMDDRLWLAALCVSGVAVYMLAPRWGFTAVGLVITAGSAAFVIGTRGTMILIGAQSVVVFAGQLLGGQPPTFNFTFTITITFGFAAFQLFAALMGIGAMRESRAKAALAEANDELRAAQALLRESARAGERLRISRDLHDLVGHQLTALALELEVASHQATGQAGEHVERARRIAKDVLTDLRRAVSQLRSTPNDVSAALAGAVQGIVRPRVHLDVDSELVLTDPEQAHALVRCVQEIVTNTVRHANAENLWIEVGRDASGVTVRCRDDGRGASSVRPGNGLTGMRERFEQIGGRLSYQTAPGAGFRLQANLPVS